MRVPTTWIDKRIDAGQLNYCILICEQYELGDRKLSFLRLSLISEGWADKHFRSEKI